MTLTEAVGPVEIQTGEVLGSTSRSMFAIRVLESEGLLQADGYLYLREITMVHNPLSANSSGVDVCTAACHRARKEKTITVRRNIQGRQGS